MLGHLVSQEFLQCLLAQHLRCSATMTTMMSDLRVGKLRSEHQHSLQRHLLWSAELPKCSSSSRRASPSQSLMRTVMKISPSPKDQQDQQCECCRWAKKRSKPDLALKMECNVVQQKFRHSPENKLLYAMCTLHAGQEYGCSNNSRASTELQRAGSARQSSAAHCHCKGCGQR